MKNSLLNFNLEEFKVSPWDFSNKILYDLCAENFSHSKTEHILTKVLFIGRIYAAAVERRKTKDEQINDNFYIDVIVPTFKNSKLDQRLESLKVHSNINVDNISEILETHYYLTKLLKGITNLDKRSFSSKYLHFHIPELFFIYDNRAEKALRQFTSRVPKDLLKYTQLKDVDLVYAKFFCKCVEMKMVIEDQFNTAITTRHLDNILIETANKIGLEKKSRLG
ncbi:MAG: hypothetical protein D4R93_01605 [Deltaproteobacteria bacterium]|nr:MAG: hypothetical protein D4R93_01605 [Deltaproteobacteria bacterium]